MTAPARFSEGGSLRRRGAYRLFGDGGVDRLFGGDEEDRLDGGAGTPDRCDGEGGTDTVIGGCEVTVNVP